MYLQKPQKYKLWVLSILSGLCYVSWPLGYWLNPAVSKNSLASGLEAVGQPYNWSFVLADIVSSIMVIVLCLILWSAIKNPSSARTTKIALVAVVLYGVSTIADAVIPERCVPNLQQCPSFTQDHVLLIHGLFSILASVLLFVSLCVIWLRHRTNVILISLLLGYILFGIISLLEAVLPGNNGNWSQHYYITLCGVWLMFVPYAIEKNSHILATQRAQKATSSSY